MVLLPIFLSFEFVFTSLYIFLLSASWYADSEGLPIGKLDLWRRLSVALGSSKGKPIFAMISTIHYLLEFKRNNSVYALQQDWNIFTVRSLLWFTQILELEMFF